jgi:Zn-dependent peptidase ImmA (M78 family)/transcriptional regulator with XRE-family HTH domain
MPSPIEALMKPELLAWARRSANLEPLAAARKIKVTQDRIEEWEKGQVAPTVAELRRAATVYNRALGVFYLPAPPGDFETLRDFRRLGRGETGEWSAALHAEYRRAHQQRDVLLEIAELDDTDPRGGWRLASLRDDDNFIAEKARQVLLDGAPLAFPTPGANQYAHLHFWSSALEERGLLVMSTEGGQVSPAEMRAFSLYFETLPVIMLNGADWPRGRLFSLLHEYAHLLLHTAGLCDTTTDRRALTESRQLEARCNSIAAAILLPAGEVLAQEVVIQHPPGAHWTLDELMEGAKPFGVSVESFLRRLVTLNRVSLARYRDFRDGYDAEQMRGSKSSGGNFYYTKARDLGKGFVRTVTSAHRRALLDSTTTATYLDVKVGQITRLAEVARL